MPYKNPAYRKEYAKKYREENRDKANLYGKKYREKNRGKITKKARIWRQENVKASREIATRYYRTARTRVLEHYCKTRPVSCACCGEDTYEFLCIDHINGGGNKHKAETGNSLWAWLRKNKYPPGFQILCHNCNMAKGFYKICPHNESK